MDQSDYFKTNQNTWNQRTDTHYGSDFYDSSAFAKAKNSLKSYEIEALGNVNGKSLLHLQCHFGQDTLSWAHKGALVTGVDFSESAINKARELSNDLDIPAVFKCCNVLDTAQHVDQQFDIVFTSYGVIGWLPDLKPWAQMIAAMLKPGGTFYMVEFHPIAWMFDYLETPATMKYAYSNREVVYEEYQGTYAASNNKLVSKEYTWNHSLSEVIQSLIDAGMSIELCGEHDGSPYDVFPEMLKKGDLYFLKDQLFPTIFEIKAVKS